MRETWYVPRRSLGFAVRADALRLFGETLSLELREDGERKLRALMAVLASGRPSRAIDALAVIAEEGGSRASP